MQATLAKPNFSFDERVAGRYETQRRLPARVSAEIGSSIAQQVGGQKQVLEIGIGTGRIAKPVSNAGCAVTGFDLSANMLAQAHAKIALAQANMLHMPYRSASFDAVMAVHVLHLERDWQRVLREVMRVLKPSGVLIRGSDWVDPDSVFGRLRHELRMRALNHAPNMMPPSARVSKDDFLHEIGGGDSETVIAAEWETTISPAQRLEMIEQRLDSESWFLPQPLFEILLAELKQFSAETWPDQNAQQVVKRRFMLTVTPRVS